MMKRVKDKIGVIGMTAGIIWLAACGAAPPSAGDSPLAAPLTTEGITTLPTPDSAMESPIEPSQLTSQPSESSTQAPRTLVTVDPGLAITPTPETTPVMPANAQNPAVIAVREALIKERQIQASVITVTNVEQVDWPDGCLGVRMPDVLCLQVIVPGYRITLNANGQQYVYHTDLEGEQIVLASPRPRP